MRVIDTKQIYAYRRRMARKQKVVRGSVASLALLVLFSGSGYIVYQRPLPEAPPNPESLIATTPSLPTFSWPPYGQAAIGAKSYGVLAQNGAETSVPTASVAKIMTAYAVLRKRPLSRSSISPVITLGDDDVALHDYYASHDGSVVNVASGEKINQYQALQAMLLPSANNMAESLARWAFGSTEAYLVYANNLAVQLGMTKTHIADASGFSATTVSSFSVRDATRPAM